MTATELFARSINAIPHDGPIHECGMCGARSNSKLARNVIKDSFMQNDLIHGDWICWACETALNDRRSRSSFIARENEYIKLERRQIWPTIWNPPDPPFIIYCTTAGKKHGLFLTQPAQSRHRFPVQCDHQSAWYQSDDRFWMEETAKMLLAGVLRDSLETGHYNSNDYIAVGAQAIREYEQLMTSVRHTEKHTILFGLMPGKDNLKEIL